MPVIALVALMALVCGGVSLVRWRRASRALRRLRDLNQTATAPALPPREVQDALATLMVDDITAARLESSAREWVPTFDDTRSAQQPMRPLLSLMATIRQNSLVLTGLEQALLNAPALAESVQHLTLLDYALMAPGGAMETAMSQVLHEMAQHTAAHVVAEGAKQVVEQVMGALKGDLADHIGAALADPVQLAELANHVVMQHAVVGPAIFDALANHSDAVKIGFEFAQNVVGLNGLAADAAIHGVEALNAAGQALMEHGLSFGQAGVEVFLQQHGEQVALRAHDLMANHAEGMGAAVFHHVPIFSGIIFGYREFRIWQRGDAEFATVAKNWGIDVGSRWSGGAIGGAIGTFLMPGPGTLVGSITGAVLFSMFGGRLKEHDYREAAKHAASLDGQLQRAITQCEDTSIPLVRSAVATARDRYLRAIGHVPRLETAMPPENVQTILRLRDDVATAVRDGRQVVANAARVSKRGWFNHPFVRITADVQQMSEQLGARLIAAQAALPSVADVQARPLTALATLGSVANVPVGQANQARYQQTLRARLADVQAGMPRYRQVVADWNQNALHAYGVALGALQPTVERQLDDYTQAIEPLFDELQVAVTRYNKEAAKLGKKHAE